MQPSGHNRHGPTIGGSLFGEGELGPHVTQCRLVRGLPSVQWLLRMMHFCNFLEVAKLPKLWRFAHYLWPPSAELKFFMDASHMRQTEFHFSRTVSPVNGWGLPKWCVWTRVIWKRSCKSKNYTGKCIWRCLFLTITARLRILLACSCWHTIFLVPKLDQRVTFSPFAQPAFNRGQPNYGRPM